ncbi:MAG TPA: hypothetical protein VNZ49_12650 [Bacteroidia bacterium]|jgi:hypothetical protein|nr:hypothetical protein [Bacteroidia bacterium]
MQNKFPHYYFIFFFLFIPCFCFPQLSSFEVSGSSAVVNNLGNRLNGTRDIMLRYNQKIGWFFSGNLGIAYNVTRFNTLPKIHNDYVDLKNTYQSIQLGGNFNLLTAIRTIKAGGKSAIGSREIMLKHVKIYLCAGAEFLTLKKTDDIQSWAKTNNIYGGFGLEVYRMGRLAKQKHNALVPFFETRYFKNVNGGYYSSTDGFVNFTKIVISVGFKFTYGLPEAK